MGKTYRKDKVDKKYIEGRNKKDVYYPCNCWLCTKSNVEKNILKEKIVDREMRETIKKYKQ